MPSFAHTSVDGFGPNANHTVYCVAAQPDGKVLAGGFFTQIAGQFRGRIARLDSGGAFDAGFAPAGPDDYVTSLAAQPDGKVVVGGQFTQLGGSTRSHVGRLNAHGTIGIEFDADTNGSVQIEGERHPVALSEKNGGRRDIS